MNQRVQKWKIRLSVMRGAMQAELAERVQKKGKLNKGHYGQIKTICLKEGFCWNGQDIYFITEEFLATKDGNQYKYGDLSHDELVELLNKVSTKKDL